MPPNIDQERRVINDPNATFASKVAAAATLWELVESATKALNPFKTEVRALAVATGLPVASFNGEGMSQCRVVLPGPTLRLTEGFNPDDARKALGPLFDTLFETKVQLRHADPGFVATLPPNITTYMASVTELVPSTPRVSLRSLSGVEEVK